MNPTDRTPRTPHTSPTAATFYRRAGKFAVAAAFLSGSLAVTGLAAADEPTTGELLEQIQKLQQQVEAMNAKPAPAAEGQTAEAKAADADPVARSLADAEARNNFPMLQTRAAAGTTDADGSMGSAEGANDPDPFTAGHNGKFLLQSADGKFSLNPNFQLQVRYVANLNGDADVLGSEDDGFEIRRFKVGFKGNAFSKDLTYDFKFAFERNGGAAVLENAFIDYTPDYLYKDNFGLGEGALGFRIGQYKDTTFYEEFTSSSRQMAVDRSLVNETIGGGQTDFVQGVGLLYNKDKIRAIVAYIDGAASSNTNFERSDTVAIDNVDWGLNARVDYFFNDDAKNFENFSAIGIKQNTLRVGGGFNYTGAGDSKILFHTIDASYKMDSGLGLFAAYYGQYSNVDGSEGYNEGAELQASQALGTDGWEVFGRFDFVNFKDAVLVGADSKSFFPEFTVGVNKYWQGDKVKMTVDLGYLPNGNPTVGGSKSGIGLRASNPGELDQVYIRGQFQLLL